VNRSGKYSRRRITAMRKMKVLAYVVIGGLAMSWVMVRVLPRGAQTAAAQPASAGFSPSDLSVTQIMPVAAYDTH
jgi:hypothetical protein